MKEKKQKKKSLVKKIIKWFSVTMITLLILLIAIPFLFKDKIVQIVTNSINSNINATVSFKKANLSFLRSFPLASLSVNDVLILNKEPFLGDTLFSTENLSLDMKVTELFKSAEETISLQRISTSNGRVNIISNKDAIANYDIAIQKEKETQNQENNSSFSLSIEEYLLQNIQINYLDELSTIKVSLDSIYHSGKGNFEEKIVDLETKTTTKLSFEKENIQYLDHLPISLDAILELDLKNSKFSFKENSGIINQLPLEFDGFVQLIDENQLYDLSFKTPTSSFKNALALLPKHYSGNLKDIQTKGNFDMNGVVKGTLSAVGIPMFTISLSSKNAMFKYSELPKSVDNIYIDTKIINKTGKIDDTFVNLENLTFKIDEDTFLANGSIANITSNPRIKLTAKGNINLANIRKVYPTLLKKELEGMLNANVTSNFDINSIDKGNYQNIKNEGKIVVQNFKYEGEDVANPFFINKTAIAFNTNSIQLNEFIAKTGTSDLSIDGKLNNFYGFLFKNQVLQGNFNLNSTRLIISDFLSEDTSTTNETSKSTLKIPSFLDVKLNAKAKNVVYDDINLSNVSGNVYIKNESVTLQNVNSGVFGGKIAFNGNVSTKESVPKFNMDLDLKELNISDSFDKLDMLTTIAPIAKSIQGKLNSTIKVSGDLNTDMTPNLKTISGNLLGQLLNTKFKASNSEVLKAVGTKMNFLDINKLNLDKASALLSFDNGEVHVQPFQLKYNDIGIQVGGKHGFDNSMNYNISFDVPTKYLGSDVTSLLAKLTPKDAETVKNVPVKAHLTGSFTNPKFTSNLKDATANLMKDLVEKQKQSLINKGKDKLTDLLLGGAKKTNSTNTKKSTVNDKVKGLLDGFLKKKKDTVKKN